MAHDDLQARMAEATRLTAAGRLTEATAVIQAALRGDPTTWRPAASPRGRAAELVRLPIGRLRRLLDRREPGPSLPGGAGQGRADPVVEPRRAAPGRAAPGRIDRGRADTATPREDPSHTGRFVSCTYRNAAGSRDYKLYLPADAPGHPLPLVVMLHGGTQTADDFALGTRMNALAERDSFLVAYPEQPAAANASRCWNWFQPGHQTRDTGEPSLIAGIVRQVMGEQGVDPTRVYVAGFSAGGAMAAVMAAAYPDLFAAAGVHSGLACGLAHDLPSALMAMRGGGAVRAPSASTPLPLIVFHGDRDRIVHPVNAQHLVRNWSGGEESATPGPAVAVEEGGSAGGRAFTRVLYPAHDGTPDIELWVVHQAGHVWSGGSSEGSYADPRGPDASATMVRFFAEHPKRGAPPPFTAGEEAHGDLGRDHIEAQCP